MVRTVVVNFVLACATFAAAPVQATSYKVLHVFLPGTDGTNPQGNLILLGKTLYGTTYSGGTGCGSFGCGTIFSINPSTGAEQVVYSFKGGSDGSTPFAGLLNVGGTLYGTTLDGGASGNGTAFSFDPATATEQILYSFKNGSDGAFPEAAFVNVGGLLYGTTANGGSSNCTGGCGTIFSLNPTNRAERVLFSFPGSSGGAYPETSLIDINGKLFGTTIIGGTSLNCRGGCGTVFQVGAKAGHEEILHSFQNAPDGTLPEASPIKVGHALYGTTSAGGPSGSGTVYLLEPKNGTEQVVYSFLGGSDGAAPEANLTYVGNTLFGTTWLGGGSANCGNGCGTIFALSPASGKEQVVHAFQGGTDGSNALSGLIKLHGTLYGITYYGGSTTTCGFSNAGCGTVFAYTP